MRCARRILGVCGATLLCAPAAARANVNGTVEIAGQAVNTTAAGTNSTATLLQETVALHYAGLPFGPTVALVTLGGGFTNVDGALGSGGNLHGRVYSFDLSAALFPLRAYPLRFFTRGSVTDGLPGVVASASTSEALAYGAALNLQPYGWMPALRLEGEEARSSHLAGEPLSDVRRDFTLGLYKQAGDERVSALVRVDTDRRHDEGKFDTGSASLTWSGPTHDTTLAATEIEHSAVDLAGLASEREASAGHVQRFGDRLAASAVVRYGDASTPHAATGRRGEAEASVNWKPVAGEDAVLSAFANGGATHTVSSTATVDGTTAGGGARAGYARRFGFLQAAANAGLGTSSCDCGFGNRGSQTTADGGISLGLLSTSLLAIQADYAVARVFAPLSRGGRRLEQHVRSSARVPLTAATELTLSLGYDDGFRELIAIDTGTAYTLHELAGSAALGWNYRFNWALLGAEVRYARGAVVVPPNRFVAGTPSTAHALTSGSVNASMNLRPGLQLTAVATASRTDLDDARPLLSTNGVAGLNWRVGQLTCTAQYQILRTDVGGNPATQQSIRAGISRPFEL